MRDKHQPLVRHSRESGNPCTAWIPGRATLARNDGACVTEKGNVEVTGAARLYRAASVWTAGLGLGHQHMHR